MWAWRGSGPLTQSGGSRLLAVVDERDALPLVLEAELLPAALLALAPCARERRGVVDGEVAVGNGKIGRTKGVFALRPNHLPGASTRPPRFRNNAAHNGRARCPEMRLGCPRLCSDGPTRRERAPGAAGQLRFVLGRSSERQTRYAAARGGGQTHRGREPVVHCLLRLPLAGAGSGAG